MWFLVALLDKKVMFHSSIADRKKNISAGTEREQIRVENNFHICVEIYSFWRFLVKSYHEEML